jgi:Immunity protein Imm1
VPAAVTASYFDPASHAVVSAEMTGASELNQLLDRVVGIASARGVPAVELQRDDGSALTMGTDGTRACLVWIDSLGHSFHSVGGAPGAALVYDFMGSQTEVPSEWTVPPVDARAALQTFLTDGSPSDGQILFEAE